MESLTATPQHNLPDVHQFTAQASGMQDMQGWSKPMAWPLEAGLNSMQLFTHKN